MNIHNQHIPRTADMNIQQHTSNIQHIIQATNMHIQNQHVPQTADMIIQQQALNIQQIIQTTIQHKYLHDW